MLRVNVSSKVEDSFSTNGVNAGGSGSSGGGSGGSGVTGGHGGGSGSNDDCNGVANDIGRNISGVATSFHHHHQHHHHHNQHHQAVVSGVGNETGGNIRHTDQHQINGSAIDVKDFIGNHALKQVTDGHFDMSGLLNIGQIGGHIPNALNPSTNHLLSSTTSLSSFVGLSYHYHHHQQQQQQQRLQLQQQPKDLNETAGSAQAHLLNTMELEKSNSASAIGRNRNRSSQHDCFIKCHYCPKKWADESLLHMHMEECRLLRMHECQQCGKRFKARGGLQQHTRIHSNDRPYQCRFCPKRFTQKSHVDQHERIHTGSKPFSCQFCGRAFRQRSQQLGHEATHGSSTLSIAASMSANQQNHVNDKSSIGQSNMNFSKTSEAALSSGGHRTQLNNIVNTKDIVSQRNTAGEMFAHNAVTSLLALSQGIHLQ